MHHDTSLTGGPAITILMAVLSITPTVTHINGITEQAQMWLPVFQIGAALIAIIVGIKVLAKKDRG